MKKKMFVLVTLLICTFYIPNVFAAEECVLGPKVTNDVNGALNIVRIVGPIILFVFTLYDTITSLSKGDGADGAKTVFGRLKMRFVYLLLLIFIPTIVQLLLQAMGLTANCDIGNSTVSLSEQANQEAEKACNALGGPPIGTGDYASKKSQCEAAGCTYNHSGLCSSK